MAARIGNQIDSAMIRYGVDFVNPHQDGNSAVSARRLFREELPDDASFLLVLDAREQLCPQLSNCFWFIERQLLIHLAALKVTGLAAGLEYRPDVRSEGGPFRQCLSRVGGLIRGSGGFR